MKGFNCKGFSGYIPVAMLMLFFLCVMCGTVFSQALLKHFDVGNLYDLKRIIVLAFISVMAVSLLFYPNFKFVYLSVSIRFFIALFFLSALLSIFFSSKHVYWSFIEVANFFLLFFAFYSLSSLMSILGKEQVVYYTYIASLCFSASFLLKYWLFLFFTLLDGKVFGIHDIVDGFFNVRFFNQLQVILVPFLFLSCFIGRLNNYSKVSFICISMHWMVLMQSEARGAMFSLVVSFLLLLLFLDRDFKTPVLKFFLGSLIAGVGLWFIFVVVIPYYFFSMDHSGIRLGSSHRLDMWIYAIGEASDSFWFGLGPMAYAWADMKPLYNAHPHNIFIQVLYEYGVFGLFIVLFGIGALTFNCLFSVTRKKGSFRDFAVAYSILCATCYAMFSGVVVMPFSQVLFVFSLALNYCGTGGEERINSRGRLDKFWKIILIILVLFLVKFISHSYNHTELKAAHIPRIWITGLVTQ